MRVKTVVLVAALLAAACGSSAKSPNGAGTPTGGAGGTDEGGSGGSSSGGSGGKVAEPAGGSGGAGGQMTVADAAPPAADTATSGSLDMAPQTGTGGSAGGGKVLYVGGAKPLVGNDGLIHDALKARGLEIEDVQATAVTPAMAEGKRLMIVSYSIQSGTFKGADFADVKVPVIVLEHNVLAQMGLTDGAGHGYVGGGTLTVTGTDPALTAGLMGDVTVYGPAGKEMFWGVPGPGAIKVATVKGNAAHVVYFVYPEGAMMAAKAAPAKRMQFFVASHAPPPVTDQFLNPDGLKLLGAALDWMLK